MLAEKVEKLVPLQRHQQWMLWVSQEKCSRHRPPVLSVICVSSATNSNGNGSGISPSQRKIMTPAITIVMHYDLHLADENQNELWPTM